MPTIKRGAEELRPGYPGHSMEDLLALAIPYLDNAQDRLQIQFNLGEWSRFDVDQVEGKITFSSDDKVGVVADVQIVGSIAHQSNRWLWSWANPSVLEVLKSDLEKVSRYGRDFGMDQLSVGTWSGGEEAGWQMTAISAYLLKADGAYRATTPNGAVFMVLKNVRKAS